MNSPVRLFLITTTALCLGLAPAQSATATAESATKDAKITITDQPLESYRAELLELSYSAVSRFPLQPHIKNRSRAQERVAVTAFELDQPLRALRYVQGIANWRQGAGYADYAYYCAKHGASEEALNFLQLAVEATEDEALKEDQAWRRDRIRAKIARTYHLLDQPEKAAPFEAGMDPAEAARLVEAKAETLSPEDFEVQMQAIDVIVEKGEFQEVRNALGVCATLFDQFYTDEEMRGKAREKIYSSWDLTPAAVRIELLLRLSDVAFDHEDTETAAELVEEIRAFHESTPWSPDFEITLMVRIATQLHRAGQPEAARKEANAALALFDKEREKISSVFRSDALRTLAEAFHAIGSTGTALAVYKRALDEGADNPNARPRADDLAQTCCSMAKHGVAPDEGMWVRLREIHDGLVAPW